MDKNQFKKRLSLITKTIDHHLIYRLSPTKSQSSNVNQSNQQNEIDQSNEHNNNPVDPDARGERIFKDFTTMFDEDGNILEFDIIKVDDNLFNRSPVILIDHHIAIESWGLKPVYKFLYKQLLSHNKKEIVLNDGDLKPMSRLMLLLNSNASFVWNIRKTLVQDGLLSVEEDLKVSELILKSKPKNPENFVHREWLIMFLSKQNKLTSEILSQELEVCLNAAHQYASNYYAWNHRLYIVNKFFKDDLNFLLGENELIKRWINNHISDYSGYHYKQTILSIIFNQLANDKAKIVELLNNENLNSKKLIQIYPNQEALFCHKRYLLKLKYLHIGLDENDVKEEQEFARQSFKTARKFENNWLITLTNRYIRWIEYNCKIQIDVPQ